MLTREEVEAALVAQGLTRERLGDAGYEVAIEEAMRPRERILATTTRSPSPEPSHGMTRAFDAIPPDVMRLKAERLAAHRLADWTPEEPEEVCGTCDGVRRIRVTRDINHPDFGRAIPCPDCVHGATPEERWARAHIPFEYSTMTLDNFRARGNAAAPEVGAWAGDRNLLVSGDTGRGKTHLAVAALRREVMERGGSGRFVDAAHMLDDIRRRYGPEELESAQAFVDSLAAWPLLVLDDLGAERPNDWVVEQVTSLIGRRLQEGRITIITTNLADADAIERHYTVDGNRMGGQRIASRLGPRNYHWVRATGPDMRRYAQE